MKRSTLILAVLMTLGSASAFAEGGAERMRYYYETLRYNQQVALGNITPEPGERATGTGRSNRANDRVLPAEMIDL